MDELTTDESFLKSLESDPVAKIEFLAERAEQGSDKAEAQIYVEQLKEFAEQSDDCLLQALAMEKLANLKRKTTR